MPSQTYGFKFDTSYLTLPTSFYQLQSPTAVADPTLVIFNECLASEMGLNILQLKTQGEALLVGNALPTGTQSLAQAYAGHQFGHFNLLGDGRAILLGEHIGPAGARMDIQLKGAGQTPYSRRGDGRATLGPMLREYVMSEAMHALGIPTTRSLAVSATGEKVYRENALPGAVLTRVAASHLRVGTFQYAAALQDDTALKALADYTIQRHFPHIAEANQPYLSLLKAVIRLQARLVAQWMCVGFIHGVMNTDNMSICGETIDYGPCAFMNAYHVDTVFSSIDQHGRYAFGNQPKIAQWNLTRFAEALLPLLDATQSKAVTMATDCLAEFQTGYMGQWLNGMRKKLGLVGDEADDIHLIEALLMMMQKNQADYTNTFYALSQGTGLPHAMSSDPDYAAWFSAWQARVSRQAMDMSLQKAMMQAANPVVIPRNHLMEEALNAAVNENDMSLVNALLSQVTMPYAQLPRADKYTQASPLNFDAQYQTFCGT